MKPEKTVKQGDKSRKMKKILKAVVCGGILSLTLVSPFSLVLSGERTFAQGTDTLDRLNEPNQWGQDMFPEENKTNRFLVKYQIGEREKAEMEIEKHVKKIVKSRNQNFDLVITEKYMTSEDLLSEMVEEGIEENIEYIQPDYQLMPASLNSDINDPYFKEQWGLGPKETLQPIPQNNLKKSQTDSFYKKDMGINANVFQAWGQSQGEGVIVAVLDTGIDITHEDLQENIWVNKGEIPDNGIDDDLNGCVDDIYGWDFCHNTNQVHHPQLVYDEWHGTHIAGIIAGVAGNGKGIAGVAPKAEIMPLKVFAQGISYTSDVINAIEYAKKMGAQIANCSWETNKENPALRDVMESSPMFFVCAAGNSHSCIDENPVYPAYFPAKNIITVASINEIGNLSGFSNYGEKQVDVAAPGEEIMSTLPENNYARSSGTSQAAAFVSGEAALLLSQNFDIKAEDLGTLITGSSDRLTSLFDKVKGGYKINCENGVSGAGPNPVIVVEVPTVKKEEGNNFNINSNPIVLSEENQWMAKADMPTARSGFGTAVLEGKIYAIGGQSRTTIYDIVEVLDPENNTWASKESMPKSRRYLGTAALNGKVYAIGGLNSSGAFLNSVEEYDPETDNWTSKTGMFTSRAHLGAASCNGKIYALGGYNNASGMVNTVEEYDPETNSWTQKASMPIAVRLFGVAVEEGSIYVIGGLYDTEPGPWVQQYQPDTNVWSYKAAMPTFRGRLAAASAGGKIYALGGELISGNTAIVEEYDPVSNTWKRKPSLLQARCELGGAAVDGSLYAIGGMESFWYYYDDVEEYTPDVSQQFHYTYDENNRLERVELPSGEVIEFEYDANGNLIRKSQ